MSQLSGHCDIIGNRLWRHQQNENRASETRGQCVKIVLFIVNYKFVMSCKKQNNVCTLVKSCFCTHLRVLLMFIIYTPNKPFCERWNSLSLEYIHYSPYNVNSPNASQISLSMVNYGQPLCNFCCGCCVYMHSSLLAFINHFERAS